VSRLPAFLARRAAIALLGAFVVASLTIALGLRAPGDYVGQSIGMGASADALARARTVRGLDGTPSEQYVRWLSGLARLDLGTSLVYQRPVAPLVAERTANTLVLAVLALAVAALVGVPLGVFSGSRTGGVAAALVRTASLVCLSLPPLLASLLLVWAAARLGWLAPMGARGASALPPLSVLVVPTLALALPVAATLERLQAEAVRRALADPCMTAALARGVSPRRLVWAHALRLGAGSVLGVAGVLAGAVLSGSVAVELVTSWPGLGRLSYEAFIARDVHLAAACAGVAALLLALGITASDVALAHADPRAAPADGRPAGAAG
jgi:peptide/nickel transport system permease protein